MNVALAKPWTPERFFAWAERQSERYEFDGEQPVAMTGGTLNHGVIMRNLHRALDARLRGTACQPLGPDVGVTTVRHAVRYPDALITCSEIVGSARTAQDVAAVFEIMSPTSGRTDRIVKVREYAAVPTIRQCVIIEYTTPGLLVRRRKAASDPWTATTLANGEVLVMEGIGITIPVAEFYENVNFGEKLDPP